MIQFNILGYFLFAFITCITPGPNNYMLFAQGKTFGFKASIPVSVGVVSGFFILLMISGYGIGALLLAHPGVALSLKLIASVWLVYLGWMLRDLRSDAQTSHTRIGYFTALVMQFVNPKAWIMAINGASAFLPHYANLHVNVLVYSLFFAAIGIPCSLSWILLGDTIALWLKSENAHRFVGNILFLLMLVTVVTIWI